VGRGVSGAGLAVAGFPAPPLPAPATPARCPPWPHAAATVFRLSGHRGDADSAVQGRAVPARPRHRRQPAAGARLSVVSHGTLPGGVHQPSIRSALALPRCAALSYQASESACRPSFASIPPRLYAASASPSAQRHARTAPASVPRSLARRARPLPAARAALAPQGRHRLPPAPSVPPRTADAAPRSAVRSRAVNATPGLSGLVAAFPPHDVPTILECDSRAGQHAKIACAHRPTERRTGPWAVTEGSARSAA
jgi:hypothetical protein